MSEQSGPISASDVNKTAPRPSGTTTGPVGERIQEAGSQALGQATEVLRDAQGRGASLVGEVKGRAASAAETGKDGLADQLEDVAKALHRSGEQLEGHQDWIAHLVERGADELGTFASTLKTNDLQGLLSKLEGLAQRQPAVFVGAAMAAGFAAVRFGKVAVAGATRADLPNMPGASHEPD